MGKVFERMINRRLITELEDTGRLDARQYAFRAGKGTEAHLAQLENLLKLEEGQHAELVSLDISKAYDTTWRPGILKTLKKWRICGRMLNIIGSYLSNRTFRVAANGETSSIRVAENGVPQGPILSVTQFLVAMQPIFDSIPSNVQILVYADDVILIATVNNFSLVRKMLRNAVSAGPQALVSPLLLTNPYFCIFVDQHIVSGAEPSK